MRKPSKQTTAAILVPLGAAIIARLFLWFEWLDSPLRYYHTIPTLDMFSHIRFAEWFSRNEIDFSLHRFISVVIMYFNNGNYSSDVMIFIQILLGIPVGAMVGYMALHLTGRTWWAMLSGLLAALYSPWLMHECFLTKDTMSADLIALALFSLVWIRKHHFKGWRLPLASMALTLPLLTHTAVGLFCAYGFLWMGKYVKWNIRKISFGMIIPVLLILAIPSSFNYFRPINSHFLPFAPPVKYISQVSSSEAGPQALNAQETKVADSSGRIKNYLTKAFMLIKPYEVPNNINHYYIKNKLEIFRFLPGPLLLIPFAGVSILLLLFDRRWFRRFMLPLVYLAALAVPLIVFYPLARYRLMLVPSLALLAPYVLYLTDKLYKAKKKTYPLPLCGVAVYGLLLFPGFESDLLRGSDFVAYGKAQEAKDGNKRNAEQTYLDGVAYNSTYLPAVINLAEAMLVRNQSAQVTSMLAPYYREHPDNEGISYFYGLSMLGGGNFAEALNVLERMAPPDSPDTRSSYYFYRGECLRLLNRPADARQMYEKALETASPARAQLIRNHLN